MFARLVRALAAVALIPPLAAAQTAGTITILEGNASVLRGAGRLVAVEGMRVEFGDLLHVAEANLMQIELADKSIAQLGAHSRATLIAPRTVYFLSGWGKFNASQRDAKLPAFDVRAPLFELQPTPGVIVFKSNASEVTLYVESGAMRLAERWGGARGPETPLNQGSVYQRKATGKATVGAAMPPEFLGELPRMFRDSLPARADKFADKPVTPKPGADFNYAEVESWLKAEPLIRRVFVQRWRGKAREEPFRAALVANLNAHPEWDPILYPEKYLPKPAPDSARLNNTGAAKTAAGER